LFKFIKYDELRSAGQVQGPASKQRKMSHIQNLVRNVSGDEGADELQYVERRGLLTVQDLVLELFEGERILD